MTVYTGITCGTELYREIAYMGRDYYDVLFYDALYKYLESLPEDFVVDAPSLVDAIETHEFEDEFSAIDFADNCGASFIHRDGLTVYTMD